MVGIASIIRHFEGIGRVPISMKDVVQQFRHVHLKDAIWVKGVNLPSNVLRGTHYRFWHEPRPDSAIMPAYVSVVIYSLDQELEWQRFVCCKELIHVFDEGPIRTSAREEVITLGRKISGEDPKKINPNGDNLQWFFDELAKYQAAAILFPFSLREEIADAYAAGKVTDDMLVKALQIPVEFVRMVMNERWPKLRESLLIAG